MRPILLCLLLTACAGGSPTQYAQGIPVAPSAPAFNPAWDAPHTTGQPGHLSPSPDYPRSPYTRTLPETPESRKGPGIWASQASDGPSVSLLGFTWPIPTEAKESDDAIAAMKECAADMGRATWASKEAKAVAEMGDRRKACLAAFLMQICVKANTSKSSRWKSIKAAGLDAALLKQSEAVLNAACWSPHTDHAISPVANTIGSYWEDTRGW